MLEHIVDVCMYVCTDGWMDEVRVQASVDTSGVSVNVRESLSVNASSENLVVQYSSMAYGGRCHFIEDFIMRK